MKEVCKLCKEKIGEDFGKCYFLDNKLRIYCSNCSKKIENLSSLPEVMIVPVSLGSLNIALKTKKYSHPTRYPRRGGRYIAFYIPKPISAITHLAKVDEIFTENKIERRYLLSKITKMKKPIVRGEYAPLQGTQNTTLKKLRSSTTLKELSIK